MNSKTTGKTIGSQRKWKCKYKVVGYDRITIAANYLSLGLSVGIASILLAITTAAYSSSENNTSSEGELSCESTPDSSLLCRFEELGLCVLRTDISVVNATDQWNIMNPLLCPGMQ